MITKFKIFEQWSEPTTTDGAEPVYNKDDDDISDEMKNIINFIDTYFNSMWGENIDLDKNNIIKKITYNSSYPQLTFYPHGGHESNVFDLSHKDWRFFDNYIKKKKIEDLHYKEKGDFLNKLKPENISAEEFNI
jgi:hypothetical protein